MLQRRVQTPEDKCPGLLSQPFSSYRGPGSLRDGVRRGLSRGESCSVSLLPFLTTMRHYEKHDIQRQAGSSVSRDSSRHLQVLAGSRLYDLRMVFPRLYFDVGVSCHVLNGWTLLLRVRGTVSMI